MATGQTDLVKNATAEEKVSLDTARIDALAYRSSFQPEKRRGSLPVNLSIFSEEEIRHSGEAIKRAFKAGFCASELVAVIAEGEKIEGLSIPGGRLGLITVSQIVIKAALLKAGIPVDARFGGLLQIRHSRPLRFVDIIEYPSTSLDPSEVFIAAGMTSVNEAVSYGEGKILASYWEIPASARPTSEIVFESLERQGVRGVLKLGNTGEPVFGTPVRPGRAGMVVLDGLNPVAAAVEEGTAVVNYAMSGMMDFSRLMGIRGMIF